MMEAFPASTSMIPFLSVPMATDPIWSTRRATLSLSSCNGLIGLGVDDPDFDVMGLGMPDSRHQVQNDETENKVEKTA